MRLLLRAVALLLAFHPAFAAEPGVFRLLRLPNLETGEFVKWGPGATGTPAELSYAFVSRSTDLADMIGDCAALEPLEPLTARAGIAPEDFRAAAVAGLRLWETAAGVRFRPAADEAHADLLIGAARRNLPITFARVSLRLGAPLGENLRTLTKASICLDDDVAWSRAEGHAPGPVLSVRMTIAHEAGHVLGLDHPQGKDTVMSRSVDATFTELTTGDRTGARVLYGPPRP